MSALGWAAATGLGALVAGMAMFALGWIGGGDAKLFTACALWLGLTSTPVFLLITALAGGLLAVGLLGARKYAFAIHGPAWNAAVDDTVTLIGAGTPDAAINQMMWTLQGSL